MAEAYDSVVQTGLIQRLEKLGCNHQRLPLIRCFYWRKQAKTQLNGAESVLVTATRGFRQGCPLSPLLYIRALYVEIRGTPDQVQPIRFSMKYLEDGYKMGWVLPGFTYEDDTVLVA